MMSSPLSCDVENRNAFFQRYENTEQLSIGESTKWGLAKEYSSTSESVGIKTLKVVAVDEIIFF